MLAVLGDSITTDHISPAGNIKADSPAGKYLIEHGVEPKDFNSYGARRGNHEVMMRGTFANMRLKNQLVPGIEGGVTAYLPGGEVMPIYDAAMKYQAAGVPLVVLAGKEYGSGSSRDWAAKGTMLLGVKAVIAESYERIHRSNLVSMGVLPLQFKTGESAASLGLTGREMFALAGAGAALKPRTHGDGDGDGGRRQREDVPGDVPHRHAGRAGGVPARRHPAVRAAAARVARRVACARSDVARARRLCPSGRAAGVLIGSTSLRHAGLTPPEVARHGGEPVVHVLGRPSGLAVLRFAAEHPRHVPTGTRRRMKPGSRLVPAMLTSSAVKDRARELGFDLCGVAPAVGLAELARIHDWIGRGHAGEMRYLERSAEVRADITRFLPGARSVIVTATNYFTGPDPTPAPSATVARYARGQDYHVVLAERLEALLAWMRQSTAQSFDAAVFVDKHWVQERVVAAYAGLGWIGKHSLLINPEIGSWILLAGIATTLPLAPDALVADQCGACTLCLDACPTGAIVEPREVDARKCISYLTIEKAGALPDHRRPPWLDTSSAATSVRRCARGTLPLRPRRSRLAAARHA